MAKILRGLVYNNEVAFAVLDTTDMVNEAIKIHNLSPLSAAAFGRTLTASSYMCSMLKGENSSLSVDIKGDGIGGKIEVSGNSRLKMRGYIENPQTYLPPNSRGKLDVSGCVGKNGTITVIKDEGLKQPFVGTVELASGEIAEDFASYFTYSEQIPTAVALGVKIGTDNKCIGAGGVLLQPLPFASEDSIEKVNSVMQNFGAISSLIAELGAEGVIKKFLNNEKFEVFTPEYKCNCNEEYIRGVLSCVPESELRDIVKTDGKVSVHCHYCNKDYDFYEKDIENIVEKAKKK